MANPIRNYFCYLNSEIIGPFDAASLKKMFFEGQITAQTQCYLEDGNEWNSYQEILRDLEEPKLI